MDILRFITAGNVDDGKSTLIGRLLYDTGNIKSDVLQTVGGDKDDSLNLAYITDGLRSEREHGITIDVAYKYFTTPERKYIITDAPGHFQYTKNLVTGASSVDVIIILIDAKNGITEQTKRHSLVASFLKIPQIVVAINKMDSAGYNEDIFSSIKRDFLVIADKLNLQNITFIPISALLGDNVISPSQSMEWYKGNTLMQYLETCKPTRANNNIARLSIQCVINATQEGLEKGYAGKLLSGQLKIGDRINIYSGNLSATIRQIILGTVNVQEAEAGDNICVYLEGNIEVPRGSLICKANTTDAPKYQRRFEVTICWLDAQNSLRINYDYTLRINAFETNCRVTEIMYKTDVVSFDACSDNSPVDVNVFARVIIETDNLVAFDSYSILPETGRGILIDIETNYTSAALVIENGK